MQRLKDFYMRASVWIRALMLAGGLLVALGSVGAGLFGIGWWASSVHSRLVKIEGRIVILDAKIEKLLEKNGIRMAERDGP